MTRPLTLRIGVALVALMMAAGPALGANLRFTASLKGANERPVPIDTNAAGQVTSPSTRTRPRSRIA